MTYLGYISPILIVCMIIIFFLDSRGVYSAPSKIDGLGLFSRRSYQAGDTVILAIDKGEKITRMGRMINHARQPNAELSYSRGRYYLVANKRIPTGEEITMNYNDTPPFIEKAKRHYK